MFPKNVEIIYSDVIDFIKKKNKVLDYLSKNKCLLSANFRSFCYNE
ncbi:hypothetical protein LCGC14_1018870 [marine sediment metagenome]|uniref:Uncharacterized protein n=1 Tax=marine sediment metagenome TaxID=412755 RepID=A0A0F9MXZ2_9ZZZZ|nr:MAG: hypothetical protein Lokiarch_29430 [Candidatus Lokiarchaeum sp. GC14_75]